MVTNISKKNGKIKVFSLLTMIVCLALCISLAGVFSTLITVGGFSNITSSDLKCSAFCVYAISLNKTSTKVQARELSEITMRKNGAGYIYQGEDAFYVFASCYENKADAENVVKNLKENGTTSEIIELIFEEIIIKSELTTQEKTTLNKALSCYKNLFKKLYDLSVSIDTKLLSEIESKVLLGDITSEQQKVKTNFETVFNPKLSSSLLEIKLSLLSVESILNNLADFSSETIPYTSQVKNAYFSILFQYKTLASKL